MAKFVGVNNIYYLSLRPNLKNALFRNINLKNSI